MDVCCQFFCQGESLNGAGGVLNTQSLSYERAKVAVFCQGLDVLPAKSSHLAPVALRPLSCCYGTYLSQSQFQADMGCPWGCVKPHVAQAAFTPLSYIIP